MKLRNFFITSLVGISPILFASSISCSSKLKFDVKNKVLEEFAGSNLVGSSAGIKGISSVYRESGKKYDIVDYLKERVKQILNKDITFNTDDTHNLWFDVPAANGCENYQTVILQGHTDMVVALQDPDYIHEVEENGIAVELDGNIAHSVDYKTSLGADNGAGCAMALVLLQNINNFKHWKLRFLFTADEETGTIGAKNIYINHEDERVFYDQGDNFINYLINLDAEAKYSIYRSCAGAFWYDYVNSFDKGHRQQGTNIFDIYMEGFAGGHSGNDMDKMRLSADRAIFEILNSLVKDGKSIQLVSFDHKLHDTGEETKFSASQISQNAHVTFSMPNDVSTQDLKEYIKAYISQNWWNKYTGENFGQILNTTYVEAQTPTILMPVMAEEDSNKVIDFIGDCKDPKNLTGYYYGIYDWTGQGDNLRPKTSSNIGPISIKQNLVENKIDFSFESLTREATKDQMQPHIDTYTSIWKEKFPSAPQIESKMQFNPWEEKDDSKLLPIVFDSYKKTGANPWFKDSRGSVEPVWWTAINPNLDCACIGPYIDHAHSTQEILDISTINKAFNTLVLTLEQLNQ